jgi:hypothetical protein
MYMYVCRSTDQWFNWRVTNCGDVWTRTMIPCANLSLYHAISLGPVLHALCGMVVSRLMKGELTGNLKKEMTGLIRI